YIGVALALNWIYVALFPTSQDQAEHLSEIYNTLPESIFAAFGAPDLAFSSLEGFMATENFGLVWPLLVILIVAGLAGASLAGEIEKGTIELTLSRPVSRIQYFFSKYLTTLLVVIIFSAVSILSVPLFAQMYDVPFAFNSYAVLAGAGALFGWAITAIAFLFAAFFSERGKVFFATGGILFVMYIGNVIAMLVDAFEPIKYGSLFYYFNAAILTDGSIAGSSITVLCLVAVVPTFFAARIWQRRDISV
ncbi:MAG: ABC transporter permease subunit, partial [bacterium]|nr:ABC transporter permease subunit [bacterium]